MNVTFSKLGVLAVIGLGGYWLFTSHQAGKQQLAAMAVEYSLCDAESECGPAEINEMKSILIEEQMFQYRVLLPIRIALDPRDEWLVPEFIKRNMGS
jgi:hypothetical protein